MCFLIRGRHNIEFSCPAASTQNWMELPGCIHRYRRPLRGQLQRFVMSPFLCKATDLLLGVINYSTTCASRLCNCNNDASYRKQHGKKGSAHFLSFIFYSSDSFLNLLDLFVALPDCVIAFATIVPKESLSDIFVSFLLSLFLFQMLYFDLVSIEIYQVSKQQFQCPPV